MNNKKVDFVLIGHLQVMDEPLSSLYVENHSGKYYIFVRIYDDDDDAYVCSEVQLGCVLSYMNHDVGLNKIFRDYPSYHYVRKGGEYLQSKDFIPLTSEQATAELSKDGLDDYFDNNIAYKSVSLKNHILELLNK